ncbi:hypothetical protein BXZ70DRAFT_544918 [Cristinia sonorae]|uniref:Uncharacterized protein n=1 Tax=Cristinia sonorae TaxID=1940300 RepID=A0A8K0XLD0_9AGAR|nr:hypothetical protein BXZ70DRAFT_544918 [Cristinia sonorae]
MPARTSKAQARSHKDDYDIAKRALDKDSLFLVLHRIPDQKKPGLYLWSLVSVDHKGDAIHYHCFGRSKDEDGEEVSGDHFWEELQHRRIETFSDLGSRYRSVRTIAYLRVKGYKTSVDIVEALWETVDEHSATVDDAWDPKSDSDRSRAWTLRAIEKLAALRIIIKSKSARAQLESNVLDKARQAEKMWKANPNYQPAVEEV